MNLFKWFQADPEMPTSLLYDESTFYQTFMRDLRWCEKEVIIESPFISVSRMQKLYPAFKGMLDRGIKIHIITRDPSNLDENVRDYAVNEIMCLADMGVNVILLEGNHHRKLAIIDRKILYEGSLNILSQNNSREIMRRINCEASATEMLQFIKFNKMNKD